MEASEVKARKRALRDEYKRLRAGLGPEARAQADAAIARQVAASPAWRRAQLVLTYLSVGDEVDTRALVRRAWQEGKAVALPRVVPHTRMMDWYLVEDLDRLETSPFGVLEPPADPAHLLSLGGEGFAAPLLALVPGLAFDRRGFRLGYGGGFYDTLLARLAGDALGLCRAAQLVDSLGALGALDPWDQAVPALATEEGVRYLR